MLTTKQKNTLLQILSQVTISGNRQQVQKIMEELDKLTREVEALPTKDDEKPDKKTKK